MWFFLVALVSVFDTESENRPGGGSGIVPATAAQRRAEDASLEVSLTSLSRVPNHPDGGIGLFNFAMVLTGAIGDLALALAERVSLDGVLDLLGR